MNKIYKANTQKTSSSIIKSFTKIVMLIVIGLLGVCGHAQAQTQIGVTPYPTLKAAFDAINSGAKTGAIVIDVIGNTTEPVMAV